MREIHLHGPLKVRFGGPFLLDVRDSAEVVRALSAQLDGFREVLVNSNWQILKGSVEYGQVIGEEELKLSLGKTREIHILPAIQGAGGNSGVGKVLAGAAIIGASFMVPGAGLFGAGIITKGGLATFGTALALGGVSTMLAPSPQSNYTDREQPDQRPSFLFNGPVNTSTQGLPVPLVYGRILTGSVVISAGMSAEELDA